MWREWVEAMARRHDGYGRMLRGHAPEQRAILYAVRRMKDEAAERVQRELDADCDVVALARAQAHLSLFLAFMANGSAAMPSMTQDELDATGEERVW